MTKNFRSLFFKTPQRTKFQINSDLHLEAGQQYSSFHIAPSADYLVLGGDIGRLIDYDKFLKFLEVQTKQFEKVFLVLGNHEFYGNTFNAGLEVARKIEKEPCLNGKMILLHQKRYDIPNVPVTILGCTLWSKIPQHATDVVKEKVKDFQKIEGWTIDDHNAAHDSDLSYSKIIEEVKGPT